MKLALTDKLIKGLRPKEKAYRVSDGDGLYIQMEPTGQRLWRFRFRHGGREGMLSLGDGYPATPLAEARREAEAMREQLGKGQSPSVVRRVEREAQSHTMKDVTLRFFAEQMQAKRWQPAVHAGHLEQMESHVFPFIGKYALTDVTYDDVAKLTKAIVDKGLIATAFKVLTMVRRVFDYGYAHKLCIANPAGACIANRILPKKTTKHQPAQYEPLAVGELLHRIRNKPHPDKAAQAALMMLPYVFVRPKELRHAKWGQMRLDGPCPEWRIPEATMKMREGHVVPLARQVVEILKALRPHTEDGPNSYVFAGSKHGKPYHQTMINCMLRNWLGYPVGHQTSHGFRTTATVLMAEAEEAEGLVELQLAHKERNTTRASYLGPAPRMARLNARRALVQRYADRLDELAADYAASLRPHHKKAA